MKRRERRAPAAERDLQVASACELTRALENFMRAGVRELKRHKCRAPGAAQAFLQAFLERAANGHRFADAFHLRGERGFGLREFLEGKARPAIAGLVTT